MRRECLALLTFVLAACALGCNDTVAPATPSSPASPVTKTFASNLTVNGSAAYSFTAGAGTVSVTLTAVGPPSNVIVGLGLGIPTADGRECRLNQSVQTGASANPQLAATVEAGAYCVRIYDVGNLTRIADFSITIVYP